MVAKKAKTFPEYTPIGDEISVASAYVQAAIALDVAAQFAQENRDSEALTQIAAVWMEMGSRLNPEDSEEELEEGDLSGGIDDYPLGFAPPDVDAEIKRKRDEKNGKHKSNC